MSDQNTGTDSIRFYDPQSTKEEIAVIQMHGDRQVCVRCRIMEWTPERMVSYTRYDPGLILARHSHSSDSIYYILEGEVSIDGRSCPAGTQIVLPKDAPIGPLIAGPEGCTFLESYAGDVGATHLDEAGFQQMLAERGIRHVPVPHLATKRTVVK